MPLGGSTSIGTLGYVEAFHEIIEYENKNDFHFDTIVLASGSGGTQAGLVAGKALEKTNHTILGISVGKNEDELTSIVYDLSNQVTAIKECKVSPEEIIVDDSYVGECYGAKTPGGEEAISLFAKKEGILLDYVYTGKAAAASVSVIWKGSISHQVHPAMKKFKNQYVDKRR